MNMFSPASIRGDVLMLDNLFTIHGRNPFRGPRRILTGMAEPVRARDVAVHTRNLVQGEPA